MLKELRKVQLLYTARVVQSLCSRKKQQVIQRLLLIGQEREQAAQCRRILLTGECTQARMQEVEKHLLVLLLVKPNSQVVQLMTIAFHPKLEKRHGVSSIGFSSHSLFFFFCYSPATTSLLSPYSYAIHGPIIKPSCSQFNTPESPSVIIIAVESSG